MILMAIEIGLGVCFIVTVAATSLLRWREVLSGGKTRETHVEQKDLVGVGMAPSIADGTEKVAAATATSSRRRGGDDYGT
jgi:hypothetical protein